MNFQVREFPAPLNIPTPIPAPARGSCGGPVAGLSGLVALRDLNKIYTVTIAVISFGMPYFSATKVPPDFGNS